MPVPEPEMVPQIICEGGEMKVEPISKPVDFVVPDFEDEHIKKAFLKKIYANGIKKKQSVRIKERRMKQNRMLRKNLLPKNALMCLNELKGVQISDFSITPNANGGGFICSVNINNVEYEAVGQSKPGAKNFCCEKAIRDIMLQKMMSLRCLKQQQQLKDDLNITETSVESKISEPMECEETSEDDVPMLNLASYAIHKLFCQWESEGFDVPDIVNVLEIPSATSSTPELQQETVDSGKIKSVGPNRDKLPDGYESMHPATVLCMVSNQTMTQRNITNIVYFTDASRNNF